MSSREPSNQPKSITSSEKDTLYCWFIVFWLFIVNCIEDGIFKAFGVALVGLSNNYDVPIWVVGSTLSMMIFVGSAAALLVGPLSKIFTSRQLMIGCGFMAFLGLFFASISRNWTSFTMATVILAGAGLRSSTVFIYSCIQDYFETHYALATGVISAGRPIGMMAFAPATQTLLYSYGEPGTLLLLSGISFHIVFVGALLKPRTSKQAYESPYRIIDDDENGEQRESDVMKGPCSMIASIFDLDVMKNAKFWVISFNMFGMIFGFQTWILYLIPHAIAKGLTPYQGTALSSFGCVGQLLGLISCGCLLDRGILTDAETRLISLIMMGVSFAVDPWCHSFIGHMLLSFICGFGISFFYPGGMKAVKTVAEETGKHSSSVFAFNFFIAATGRLLSGFLTGWFYDKTGSYSVSFLIVAGVDFASAIIVALEIAIL